MLQGHSKGGFHNSLYLWNPWDDVYMTLVKEERPDQGDNNRYAWLVTNSLFHFFPRASCPHFPSHPAALHWVPVVSFLAHCFWGTYILPLAAAAAKSLQACPTLCDPTDSSPPGSPVPGILQARTLEWVAISFSSAWKWKVKVKPLSRVLLVLTPWTAAHQAPPSMGFSRQEYWSGLPLPSPN